MFFRYLIAIIFLVNTVSPTIVEYGGISFECSSEYRGDECGVPRSGTPAEKIFKKFQHLTSWLSDAYGYDQQSSWKKFACYKEINYEDELPNLELERYDWDRWGIANIQGDNFYLDDLFAPADKYFSIEKYAVNQKSLMQAIERVKRDQLYYSNQKITHYKNQIEDQKKKLTLYLKYDAAGYTHLEFDDMDVFLRPLHKQDLEDGYYSWISSEIRIEENSIKSLTEKINKVPVKLEGSFIRLNEASSEIDSLLQEIFLYCLQYHQPEGIAFNATVESLLADDLPKALKYIRDLLNIAEKNKFSSEIMSKIYLLKGELQSEYCLHTDAIVSLTEAIQKNPFLKEAYLERAFAYFELGDFHQAIDDYLIHEEFLTISDRSDFAKGFLFGTASGCWDATLEFLPNTLSSLHGLSHFLWATVQHPIEAPRQLIVSVLEIFDLIRKCSVYELTTIAIPELEKLISTWDQIDDFTRGQQAGQILGKYGVELITPLAVRKGAAFICHFKELKKAEKLATLKTLQDSTTKEELLENATKWSTNRSQQLAKVRIEIDKQNKHIPGSHNYNPDKSIFLHKDPQFLLDKFAGKGRKMGGIDGGPGTAGYKEKVDFKVIIGKTVNEKGVMVKTTWGSIEYSAKGAHIVPRLPDQF